MSLASALVVLLALADLGIRAAVRLETRWDTFSYHVPFAALRGGLAVPYDLNDSIRPLYEGFPPLPHLVEGLLWRLTGSVNATGVACYLAFSVFLIYCHIALRARFWLVALISLTAPLVVIHTTVSYVDLFGNSLLAIGASSCLSLYLFPDRGSRAVLLGGLAGLAGAAGSKYQLVPVVALVFCFFFAVIALGPDRAHGFSRRQALALLLVAAVVAAAPYARNLALYGNPFWPVRLPVMSEAFPYREDVISEAARSQRPPPLKDAAQFSLFINSLFEINHPTHYDYRPRWIIDQGSAYLAFRMGGFWVTGVITYLLATMTMLVVSRRRRGVVASLAIVATLGFVAFLPQSHELRYYLFIPLTWAATIGMLFPHFRATWPRAAPVFLVVALSSFLHMVGENSPHYEIAKIDYQDAARIWDASGWWPQLHRGEVYCAVDMLPIGILLTGPTMSEYSIVDRTKEALCPDDSIVVTYRGIQGRKGLVKRETSAPAQADTTSADPHEDVTRVLAP
ncbi:MAG TPA: hypothetical protein VGR87_01905 [Candidatus Limnocylindria bacterium]|nr:hypothetical protein [Candidatus Limnocylindria bacterium]